MNLQLKYIMSSQDGPKFHFVKSDQENPTIYISFLPQFAHELKKDEKGIIFVSNNYIVGLLGTNTQLKMVEELEALCKQMSSKTVKSNKKDQVKFDFKIKGQKPIVTKDVC